MSVFVVVVLLLGAAFNVLTWPTFLRRVARDPRARDASGARTRFYTVHLILVVLALALSVLFVVAAVAVSAAGF